jgi:diacylglycerol kinase (ATP)
MIIVDPSFKILDILEFEKFCVCAGFTLTNKNKLVFMLIPAFVVEGVTFFISMLDAIPPLVWLTLGTGLVVSFLVYAVLVPPKPVSRALTQPDQIFLATQYSPEYRLSDESDFHLLLICNPIGGNGQGLRLCELIVQPMLRVANIRYELIVTESGSHAYELATELDPEEYSGVAVIGGDCLLHEVINGLFHLCKADVHDFEEMLRTLPVGIIPTGGGNDGLANSLGLSNAYVATKRLIDSIVETKYRKLNLYSVERVINPVISGGETSSLNLSSTGVGAFDFHLTTWGLLADIELSIQRDLTRFPKPVRYFLAIVKTLLNLQPKFGSITMRVNAPVHPELVGKGLPEVDPKILTISGAFSMVTVSNVSHWKREAIIDPDARPDDGRLSVMVVRHCSRWNFLRTLVAMETGSHVSLPWVSTYRCSEVVLINETGEANICGYGEAELDSRINKTDGIRFRSNLVTANIMC